MLNRVDGGPRGVPSRLNVFEVVVVRGVDEGVGRSKRGGRGVVCMLTGGGSVGRGFREPVCTCRVTSVVAIQGVWPL